MNHDESAQKPEQNQDDAAATEQQPAPRKIMLGKRVLRHFHVKSGVKTGIIGGITDGGSTRCHTVTAVY
jgi:hypothetical protein